MEKIISVDAVSPIKQFNCTSCGASLEVFNSRAKYKGCSYCGSLLDVRSDTYQLLSKLGTPTLFKPFSFIRIGMLANFGGKKYQVIARTRWRMDYKERWVEEGEIGYSTEVWQYDEWLLMDKQRTYFYLVEDKDGFYISNEIYPTSPCLPQTHNRDISFYKGERKKPIEEIGKAKALYFEGESNYRIRVGDQIGFANYLYKRNVVYQVEWRINRGSKKLAEIEFFKETKVPNFTVVEAFEENESVSTIADRQRKWRFLLVCTFTTFLLFFTATVISYFKSGEIVFDYTQDLSLSGVVEDKSIITPSFSIKKPGLYQLNLSAKLNNNNTSIYSIAYIHNEQSEPIRAIEGNFYFWSGVEGGERWTEENTSTNQVVIIEKAGTYFAELFVTSSKPNIGSVSFDIKKNILLTRYFLIGTILLALFSFFCYNRSDKIN